MVVLKNIPSIISPELLNALAKMGHGDEIVLADANFPSSSVARAGPIEVRADGHGIPALLEAILQLLPLDTYVDSPAILMELVPSDQERGLNTPVWAKYQELINKAEGKEGGVAQIAAQAQTGDPCPQCYITVMPEGIRTHLLYVSGCYPHGQEREIKMDRVERFAYYERAEKAYAVVATGETALYGNLILKKGVISAGQ